MTSTRTWIDTPPAVAAAANPAAGATPTAVPARERRPFQRLEPTSGGRGLPKWARPGLPVLEERLGDSVPLLVRALVNFTLARQARRGHTVRAIPPTVSVLNRRRRAARVWVHALLAGRVDRDTLDAVAHSLLPQLAGTGPEVHRCEGLGRACFEFLRGAATALILDRPADNLVPEAKALAALDAVLAVHLDAFDRAVRRSRREASQAVRGR
jgi:hypothetical protein